MAKINNSECNLSSKLVKKTVNQFPLFIVPDELPISPCSTVHVTDSSDTSKKIRKILGKYMHESYMIMQKSYKTVRENGKGC